MAKHITKYARGTFLRTPQANRVGGGVSPPHGLHTDWGDTAHEEARRTPGSSAGLGRRAAGHGCRPDSEARARSQWTTHGSSCAGRSWKERPTTDDLALSTLPIRTQANKQKNPLPPTPSSLPYPIARPHRSCPRPNPCPQVRPHQIPMARSRTLLQKPNGSTPGYPCCQTPLLWLLYAKTPPPQHPHAAANRRLLVHPNASVRSARMCLDPYGTPPRGCRLTPCLDLAYFVQRIAWVHAHWACRCGTAWHKVTTAVIQAAAACDAHDSPEAAPRTPTSGRNPVSSRGGRPVTTWYTLCPASCSYVHTTRTLHCPLRLHHSTPLPIHHLLTFTGILPSLGSFWLLSLPSPGSPCLLIPSLRPHPCPPSLLALSTTTGHLTGSLFDQPPLHCFPPRPSFGAPITPPHWPPFLKAGCLSRLSRAGGGATRLWTRPRARASGL